MCKSNRKDILTHAETAEGEHMNNFGLMITKIGTAELAGFTVGGYLVEKAIEIGTGQVWSLIKTKFQKEDSFECRLYEAIESSVSEYLRNHTSSDIIAAICEQIFSNWCMEGYLTPDKVAMIFSQYSSHPERSDILQWYRHISGIIVKDEILYSTFMMDNLQKNMIEQKHQGKTIEAVYGMLQEVLEKEEKHCNREYPEYISAPPTDINIHYINRSILEAKIWNTLIVQEESTLLYGIGGIGKTETAKAILKKVCSLPSEITGIEQIVWATYNNHNIKDTLIESIYKSKKLTDQTDSWEYIQSLIYKQREKLLIVIDNIEVMEADIDMRSLNDWPCRVMVTSRVEEIGALKKYTVDQLSIEDCMDIFYHYYVGEHDNYYLKKILELSECHTVMLELLAKTANMKELSLSAYYDLLVKRGFNHSGEKISSEHSLLRKERRIAEQLKILFTIAKCRAQDKRLLCNLSVIPAIPFQFQQVKQWIEIENKSQLEYLVRTGWLQSNQELKTIYIMHSVIASAIRFQNMDNLYRDCKSVIRKITAELDYNDQEHGTQKAYLIPFSWSISDVLEKNLCDEEDSCFLTNLAYIYRDIGNYESAFLFIKRSLRINQKLNSDVILIFDDYHNLADMSFHMFQFKDALYYARKALEVGRIQWTPENARIVLLMKTFAMIYAKLNRIDRAEALFTWVSEHILDNAEIDILQISMHYCDVASFYRERGRIGDYEKSEYYYKQAEAGMKEVYKSASRVSSVL